MKKFLFAILAVTVMFTACNTEFEDVNQLDELTISDYNGFSELTAVRIESGDLVFNVKYVTPNPDSLFNSVKLYYTLNKDFTDAEWTAAVEEDDAGTSTTLEDNRVTLEIDIPAADNMYSFTIPYTEVIVGDVIRCYFRGYTKEVVVVDGEVVLDEEGNPETAKVKDYYSPAGDDTFDHDVFSGWTVITVK